MTISLTLTLTLTISATFFGPTRASAQTPRVTPRADFVFVDERQIDRFVVQRWINKEAPEVSPSGYCECLTLIYEGARRVLDLGIDAGTTRVDILKDVTGDDATELVVTNHSGGAHCCYVTTIYSIDERAPRPLLSAETGACLGEFADLDGNGTSEFSTCDDIFAYEFCSFAFSPMPPVVYAYSTAAARFVIATPSFAKHLPMRSADDTKAAVDESRQDPALYRCAVLGPVLDLVYTGRVAEGQRLFHSLYQADDAAAVEQKVWAMFEKSPHWTRR